MVCSFCCVAETEGWLKSYCSDCAMLKRMLVLHEPKICIDILRRCLIRNENQISHKIKAELKNTSVKCEGDDSYLPPPPTTRSKSK